MQCKYLEHMRHGFESHLSAAFSLAQVLGCVVLLCYLSLFLSICTYMYIYIYINMYDYSPLLGGCYVYNGTINLPQHWEGVKSAYIRSEECLYQV